MKKQAILSLFALTVSGFHAAQAADLPGFAGSALVVLHPARANALVVENSGKVSVPGGTLQVFSKSRSAASLRNGAEVTVENVALAGGAQMDRGAQANARNNLKWKEVPDSLAQLPEVKTEGLPVQGVVDLRGTEEVQLEPGVYDGIFLSSAAKVFLAPGIYIIQNEFFMNSQGSVRGEDVTLINQGNFHMEASSSLQLSAPTEGPTKDIALWQERANNRVLTFAASAKATIAGTIYLPSGTLEVKNSAQLQCTNLVADSIRVSNSGELLIK